MTSLSATNRRGAMYLSVLLLLVGTWSAAKDERKDEQAKVPSPPLATGGITHGQSDRGLAAFLVTSGRPFQSGGWIALSYGLICTANQPEQIEVPKSLKIVRPYPAADPNNHSWFSVSGPDGGGLKYRGEFPHWPRAQPGQVVLLRTGEFIGRTSIHAELHFDFSKPGKYRIRWHYLPDAPEGLEGVWTGELVSNEVQIEIVP
jgi:hypothetical protein